MSLKQFKSVISHTKDSNRVYLMHLEAEDFPEIIDYIEDLAEKFKYTKLFAKIPSKYAPLFINAGYVSEANIPNFYNNREDASFLVKYKDLARRSLDADAMQALQKLLLTKPSKNILPLDKQYHLVKLVEKDLEAMIKVFKQVFVSYPFPIYDPLFLKKSMQDYGTRYFGAFFKQELIAVSSAEYSKKASNAEMTDFAVLPSHRGKQLAFHLLSFMEKDLASIGCKTFYTISRLNSLPMNKTFLNLDYKYSGTLIQNTHIFGKIESMNVWYKNVL